MLSFPQKKKKTPKKTVNTNFCIIFRYVCEATVNICLEKHSNPNTKDANFSQKVLCWSQSVLLGSSHHVTPQPQAKLKKTNTSTFHTIFIYPRLCLTHIHFLHLLLLKSLPTFQAMDPPSICRMLKSS